MIPFFVLLILATAAIAWLTRIMWNRHPHYGVLIGVFALYYWSLAGSWFIVWDAFHDYELKNYGLHYYYLFEKLFLITPDTSYFISLVYYAVFVILIQLSFIFFSKNKPVYGTSRSEGRPVYLNHWVFLGVSVIGTLLSFLCVYSDITHAIQSHQSVYVVVRHSTNSLYTLHQLLNGMASFSALFGVTSLLMRDNKIIFKEHSRPLYLYLLYVLAVTMVLLFLLLLGNKHELLYCGIFIVLFYLTFSKRFILSQFLAVFLIIAVPLAVNDTLRRFPPKQLSAFFLGNSEDSVVSTGDLSIVSSVVFSNEMFFAHASMYGCVKHELPFTYGSSLVSLAASVVPRALWENRPGEVYYYYVDQLKLAKGQGYTIHHATAWYLNFGLIGVILGGIVLGFGWGYLRRLFLMRDSVKWFPMYVFALTGFISFCSFFPMLIRNGPEAYKALVIEGLLMPVILIWISSFAVNFKRGRAK